MIVCILDVLWWVWLCLLTNVPISFKFDVVVGGFGEKMIWILSLTRDFFVLVRILVFDFLWKFCFFLLTRVCCWNGFKGSKIVTLWGFSEILVNFLGFCWNFGDFVKWAGEILGCFAVGVEFGGMHKNQELGFSFWAGNLSFIGS